MTIKQKDISEITITHDGRMTLSNAAKYIDCSAHSLRLYMSLGIAPAYFSIVNKVYFYKKDIDEWLELQKISPAFAKSRIASQKKKGQ
jgi:hypothetical protein